MGGRGRTVIKTAIREEGGRGKRKEGGCWEDEKRGEGGRGGGDER